ncbi:MAG: imidazole glycerol phosphate synthase subunit HisH [Candidatus Omnitrophota bacterium]|jgi:glutamine amidotransferase|nr:MAG: imidazole glycerol phosphate synthase subunit HisH [Candidatus Omnitrophota bacterium]
MIAIIDYGMGNIHSVQKALISMGAKTLVTNNPKDIASCDKLVLPGVGSFGDALKDMDRQGLIKATRTHIEKKKIFLGICLGLQLLFEESEESPGAKGLGIFKGKARRFSGSLGLKVPHMGWNQLQFMQSACPLFKGIDNNSFVYFCHSFYAEPTQKEIIASTTGYGTDFASILWQDTIYALQFHPEKSQDVGLQMIKNFVEL